MRTRLFLRTAEFLWQEGHTAHATRQEAIEETEQMLDVYADFAENFMAMPVLKGKKTANERFAGAEETHCIEAMMQDGKALQAGTSHFLGQNFAKAFDVKFLSKENQLDYVWGTSWGVSTRLMGALIMAHSDDQGLVLPPKLAPTQVVIVPIFKGEEQLAHIKSKIEPLVKSLRKHGISVKFDTSENGTIELARRDTREKTSLPFEGIDQVVVDTLNDIQEKIYLKAFQFRQENTHEVNTWDEFTSKIEDGGFLSAHWDGSSETEEKIKELTKATIRCIPLDAKEENGACILTGNPSKKRVIFARAY
jgi:prolyl-tRNA synthetase